MTTNHKPATPLPWTAPGTNIYATKSRIVATSEDKKDDMSIRLSNASFIVHAVNAYPRLINAVQSLSKADWQGYGHLLPLRSEVEAARALLRELGEE